MCLIIDKKNNRREDRYKYKLIREINIEIKVDTNIYKHLNLFFV